MLKRKNSLKQNTKMIKTVTGDYSNYLHTYLNNKENESMYTFCRFIQHNNMYEEILLSVSNF